MKHPYARSQIAEKILSNNIIEAMTTATLLAVAAPFFGHPLP